MSSKGREGGSTHKANTNTWSKVEASPAMSELMKKSKIAHAKWRSEDRPDSQHELYKEMKSAKKKCRQQLRHEQAETRKQLYEDIMENASTDMFYKLIRRNRQSAKSESCSFRVNDQTVSDTEEQRSKLAEYYEDLAMPKASCDFDQAYNEDCEANLEITLMYVSRQWLREHHHRGDTKSYNST